MKLIKPAEVITEKEYTAQALTLSEALKTGKAYNGTVTAQSLTDGSYAALSNYEDMVWFLNPNDFPDNSSATTRKINFELVPHEFVDIAKRYVAIDLTQRLAGKTTKANFVYLNDFLVHLNSVGVQNTADITPLVAMQYVEHCKSIRHTIQNKKLGKVLSKSTLASKFLAVERLHNALAGTQYQFLYPWPESSAWHLAGRKQSKTQKPKTMVIPDDVFVRLFQHANAYLERSEELISLHVEISEIKKKWAHKAVSSLNVKLNQILEECSYKGNLSVFKEEVKLLESSCWLLIMATTGIRIHELGALKANSYHSRVDGGDTYYFLESTSTKTGEGETSWLCPEITIDALKVMTHLTQPLRDKLELQIAEAKENGDELTATNLKRIHHSCMLSLDSRKNNAITVISDKATNFRLNKLAKDAGVDWHLASHQFRRTFAHFVVHNQLGDLRYLRDHFKHWSLDMTSLYALDDDLDLELFNEINFAYREKGQTILEHWMDNDTPLAGGLKDKFIALRNSKEAVKTYGSYENMMKAISDDITVRSTGIAWCTNDAFGCGGGQCEECGHSVIDDHHQQHWEAIYAQQIELREIAEQVGPGGAATIERTIRRCETVLIDLGADMDAIKERVAAHA